MKPKTSQLKCNLTHWTQHLKFLFCQFESHRCIFHTIPQIRPWIFYASHVRALQLCGHSAPDLLGLLHLRQMLVENLMLLPVRVIQRVVPPNGNFSVDSSTTSSLADTVLTPNFSIRLLVSIAMGLPLTIYLWRGDKKKPNTSSIGEHHGANQEYAQNAEGNQGNDSNSTNSTHDEVRYPLTLLSQWIRCYLHTPTWHV